MKRLRAMRPELVGIALSGYGMEKDIRRSIEAGFVQHLTVCAYTNRLGVRVYASLSRSHSVFFLSLSRSLYLSQFIFVYIA